MFSKSQLRIGVFLALVPFCLFGADLGLPRLRLDAPTLTAAEKFVLAQVIAGKPADLQSEFADASNRVVRAAFLEAILTQSGTNVHRNGFSIQHAVIPDALDLRNAEVHYETSFTECRFLREVDFSKSNFENGFSLAGSTFDRSVKFFSMKIGRVAVLDKTSFGGDVSAAQMDIAGSFSVGAARFNSSQAPVNFASLKTSGDASFSHTTFAGPVTFQSANIAENFRFEGSHFTNPTALVNFEEVKVGATTSFVGAGFAGYVSFKDAQFATLDFSKVAWPPGRAGTPWLWLNAMTYRRISAGSEKDSWQNLYRLVERTAHGTAYSTDIFARLEDYYRQ